MSPGLTYACRRKNYVHAAYVSAALTLLDEMGPHRVRSMLYNHNVSEEVITRVLSPNGPVRKRSLANNLKFSVPPYNAIKHN